MQFLAAQQPVAGQDRLSCHGLRSHLAGNLVSKHLTTLHFGFRYTGASDAPSAQRQRPARWRPLASLGSRPGLGCMGSKHGALVQPGHGPSEDLQRRGVPVSKITDSTCAGVNCRPALVRYLVDIGAMRIRFGDGSPVRNCIYVIYVLGCLRMYIGQTILLSGRMSEHLGPALLLNLLRAAGHPMGLDDSEHYTDLSWQPAENIVMAPILLVELGRFDTIAHAVDVPEYWAVRGVGTMAPGGYNLKLPSIGAALRGLLPDPFILEQQRQQAAIASALGTAPLAILKHCSVGDDPRRSRKRSCSGERKAQVRSLHIRALLFALTHLYMPDCGGR